MSIRTEESYFSSEPLIYRVIKYRLFFRAKVYNLAGLEQVFTRLKSNDRLCGFSCPVAQKTTSFENALDFCNEHKKLPLELLFLSILQTPVGERVFLDIMYNIIRG